MCLFTCVPEQNLQQGRICRASIGRGEEQRKRRWQMAKLMKTAAENSETEEDLLEQRAKPADEIREFRFLGKFAEDRLLELFLEPIFLIL